MHDSPSCVCVKARRAAPAGMLCTCSHKQGSPRPSRRAGPVPSPQRPCRALVPQGADSRTHSAASQSACAAHPGSPAPRRPQRPPGRSPRRRRRPRAPRRGPPSPPRARPPSPPRSCPAGCTPARAAAVGCGAQGLRQHTPPRSNRSFPGGTAGEEAGEACDGVRVRHIVRSAHCHTGSQPHARGCCGTLIRPGARQCSGSRLGHERERARGRLVGACPAPGRLR